MVALTLRVASVTLVLLAVAVSVSYGETERSYLFRNTSLSFEDRVKVCNFSITAITVDHVDIYYALGFSWSINIG